MVRGGTITLIYRKLLLLPANDVKDSSAIAIMGNDVETLSEKLHFLLVESWANTVTVAISIWMLSEQLGAVCVAPVVLALGELLSQAFWALSVAHTGITIFSLAGFLRGCRKGDRVPPDAVPTGDTGPNQFYF